MGAGDTGYDGKTSEKEVAKEKQGWMVAISSIVAFIVIGSLIWFSGMGGKY